MTLPDTLIKVTFPAVVFVSVGMIAGCSRAVGTGPINNPDATTHPPDDGGVHPFDGGTYPPGCEPQQAADDPNVTCDCDFCSDPTPYLWTGLDCRFAPICCQCVGVDCDRRFRTYGECLDAFFDCPRPLLEVQYPDARLIWMAPGGVAGWGPALHINGMGSLLSWNEAVGGPDWERPDPDYTEELGIAQANELFDLLAQVDFTALPHEPQFYGECYPVFWLEWAQCQGCEPIRLDYAAALDLQPELDPVYRWLDHRLCRPGTNDGYPWALPSQYCMFFMGR